MTSRATKGSYLHIDQWKRVAIGSHVYYVHRYSIAASREIVYAAYEALDGHTSTLTHPEGKRLGEVTSRPAPKQIWNMPVGEGRWALCDGHRAKCAADARAAIAAAWPFVEKAGLPFDEMMGRFSEWVG